MKEKYFKAIDKIFSCCNTPQLFGIKLYEDYWKTAYCKSSDSLNDVTITKDNCVHFNEFKEQIEFLNASFNYMYGPGDEISDFFLWIYVPDEIKNEAKEHILNKIRYHFIGDYADFDGCIKTKVHNLYYEMTVGDSTFNDDYHTNLCVTFGERKFITHSILDFEDEEKLENAFLKYCHIVGHDPICVIDNIISNESKLLKQIFEKYRHEEMIDFLERFYRDHRYFDPKTRKAKRFIDIWKEYNDDNS